MGDSSQPLEDLRTIPVDREICESVLRILSDPGVRVERINELVCSDPVLLLEVLCAANGLKTISGGKAVIEGKVALVSLGLERIRELVQELAEVTPRFEGDQAFWLKAIKQKSRKAAAVCSLVAKVVRPESILECFSLGAVSYYGDLLALAKFGDRYVELLEEESRRTKVRYRLVKDFRFSLEEETVDYLGKRTLPNVFPLVLDLTSSKLMPNVQALKQICHASLEFVDAYFEDRLDRLAPGVSIPPKSYRRTLALSDDQYEMLYLSIESYLEKGEFLRDEDLGKAEEEELSEEGVPEEAEQALEEVGEDAPVEDAEASEGDPFDLLDEEEGDAVPFDEEFARPIPTAPKRQYVSKSDRAMPKFISMCEDTESVEELLERLLTMLVDQSPFESAAIIVVSPENQNAMVVAFRGRTLVEGETSIIELKDPLSPLLNSKSKVVSYSPKKRGNSPFGCGNYALSPIEVSYKRPVILYADCGDGNILTFEARRLFRKVVDMLNNILPQMEGELLLEQEDTLSS
ncbi:HDOD domain-containing protein [bacterium]|nr:HDOD domain-containing protein [bacterium]